MYGVNPAGTWRRNLASMRYNVATWTSVWHYFGVFGPLGSLQPHCAKSRFWPGLDVEASFLDLHLSISDGFVKTKIYDKRNDFDIVNFPFLDGDVPRSASYVVYISQLIRFARVSSHVDDFNTRNKVLTAKLLRQGYRYHKLRKAFSKFYRRHFDIVSKFNVGLKTLLLQGLSRTWILWRLGV